MGASKLLLSDRDSEYAGALARALSELHNEFEITIRKPDNPEDIKPGSKISFLDYDLILIGDYPEDMKKAIKDETENLRIVVLSECIEKNLLEQAKDNEKEYWHIYKYQNINNIISDLNYIAGAVTGKRSLIRKRFNPELIGFYSVSGGVGKTVIALGTSRELSRYRDKKVLYLSFEEIPATELFVINNSDNRNIGDYLYYLLEKDCENICSRPEAFTTSDEYGVEVFSTSAGRNDLNFLTQEELVQFFKAISDSGRYDYIALDLKSDFADETLYLLNLCSKIILIQNDDPVSVFKNRKGLSYLSRMNLLKCDEQIVYVFNRKNRTETARDEHADPGDEIRNRISVDHDDVSLRFFMNRMDIDINHEFGIGIKKIADEILSLKITRQKTETDPHFLKSI